MSEESRPRENSPQRTSVTRLLLTDFRSYPKLDLQSGPAGIALFGPNGAGKTNLLEALSLLAAGGGLRRAQHIDLARVGGGGGWAAVADVLRDGEQVRLGTGIDGPPGEGGGGRRCRIDAETVPSAGAFARHIRLIWLLPSMDGLFAGPASDRRRFLDRLVLAVDPEHGSRVAALERGLRSRNRLLEQDNFDRAWADAVEREIAETATSVAAARAETVMRLAPLLAAGDAAAFPTAALALEGTLEQALATQTATAVEDAYRERLQSGRYRDRAAGRTLEGPHISDLQVFDAARGMPARHCSTGEQKALLIGLILGHARLVATATGAAPVLLLDEIAAHLDPDRRRALFAAIDEVGAQAWLTAADPGCFAGIGEGFRRFEVRDGLVLPAD